MTTGKTSNRLVSLIRNPIVIAALIFVLNIVLGQIIATILNILSIKNSTIITYGGLMAAFIIGSIHAKVVKEKMPNRTKIIATVIYTLAGTAAAIIVLIATGLPIVQLTMIITLGFSLVYAIVIYLFLGLGEKGILKAMQVKKS